ncbi:lipid-A-disaccharide synthase [Rhodobacter ferrooxidans]|uniref:Lipid-A-disaccharide synthase n=1 Tax=Rhodobacter ferrooxidans TaxID=371731 RepID=C8S3Y7_9RHOB|nr:lipid-A-disaccharide synthase [Rhodobacter sp. SW2]
MASRSASRALRLGTGPVILMLPGSRAAEVTRLAPVFGDVLAGVKKSHPGAQVLLPTVPAVAGLVRQMTANWPIAPMIIEDAAGKAAAFGAADVALAASGTVALELAANGVPMVIAYNLHPASILLMQWLALTDTASLVNLVSQTRVVKEYLGWGCKAHLILPTLLELIDQTDSTERLGQITAMQMTMLRLGQGGEAPGLRAARSVLAHLG